MGYFVVPFLSELIRSNSIGLIRRVSYVYIFLIIELIHILLFLFFNKSINPDLRSAVGFLLVEFSLDNIISIFHDMRWKSSENTSILKFLKIMLLTIQPTDKIVVEEFCLETLPSFIELLLFGLALRRECICYIKCPEQFGRAPNGSKKHPENIDEISIDRPLSGPIQDEWKAQGVKKKITQRAEGLFPGGLLMSNSKNPPKRRR